MRNLFMSLFAVSFVSACMASPLTPKLHETKYTIQILEVTTPTPTHHSPNWLAESLNNTNSVIYTYPTLYAEIGETVGDDQTEEVSMPESYDLIDGKVVPKEKLVRLGKAVEVSIPGIEGENITYSLSVYNKSFKGYDIYPLEDGIEVKMPYFETRSINTEITHPLNRWISMGGRLDKKGNSFFFYVRIVPPEESK